MAHAELSEVACGDLVDVFAAVFAPVCVQREEWEDGGDSPKLGGALDETTETSEVKWLTYLAQSQRQGLTQAPSKPTD